MLTYAQLIQELRETHRDQIGRISKRRNVPAHDVEAALELFVRRGIARRQRWTEKSTGAEATVWVLESDVGSSMQSAAEKGIDVHAPLLSSRSA